MADHLTTPIKPLTLLLNSKNVDIVVKPHSDIYVNLESAIVSPSNVQVRVSLDTFSFTNSFYNINTNNNVLSYNSTTYTLPPCNIDVYSLGALLSTETAVSWTFNESTYKYDIEGDITLNDCTMYEVLGFTRGQTYTNPTTSENIINLLGVCDLYFTIENLNIQSVVAYTGRSNQSLALIPIRYSFGSKDEYVNRTNTHYLINEDFIESLHIQLLDSNGYTVDTNGIGWNAQLSFKFYYRPDHRPVKTVQELIDHVQSKIDNLENIVTE